MTYFYTTIELNRSFISYLNIFNKDINTINILIDLKILPIEVDSYILNF